jgi:hypothetical protein
MGKGLFMKGMLLFAITFAIMLTGCPTDDDGGGGGAGNGPVVTVTPGNASLTITWTAVTGEDGGYKVYIRTANETPGETNLASQTAPGTLTYTTNGQLTSGLQITNGTKYYIWVKAITGNTESGLSAVKDGTPAAPDSLPARPADPTVASLPSGQLRITWATVAQAEDYEVVIATSDSTANSFETQANITALEYTTTTLNSSTSYWVFVRAHNTVGDSPWSNSVTRVTVNPVTSVVGTWKTGGGTDTLVFTQSPTSCVRTNTGGVSQTDEYTYVYDNQTGDLTLTETGQQAQLQGTVTGNVLSMTWGNGGTVRYTKQ